MPPYGQAGSVRDRTAEFNSLADRLRSEQVGALLVTLVSPSPAGGAMSEPVDRCARVARQPPERHCPMEVRSTSKAPSRRNIGKSCFLLDLNRFARFNSPERASLLAQGCQEPGVLQHKHQSLPDALRVLDREYTQPRRSSSSCHSSRRGALCLTILLRKLQS